MADGDGENEAGGPTLPVVTSTWINRLLFLGTGTSGQVPAIACLLPSSTSSRAARHCAACVDATRPGSKNRRGCTSVAVVGGGADGAEESLILIDCGPTFYPAALTHFAAQNLRKIDAVLLTHGHADAILGLDNLRSWTLGGVIQDHVDVYCSRQCFGTVAAMFPYLVDASRATGGGGVGDLKFHIIDAQKPFEVQLLSGDSITVTPLPAHHGSMDGAPFECLGFRIDSLSYLSDCHAVPAATTQLMAGSQVIAVDALNPYRHPSHFSLSQALSFTLSMPGPAPRLSLLTDLTHNLEHHTTERAVQQWRRELQTWRSETLASPSIAQAGTGEAGGVRWWAGKWDERQSEQGWRLALLPSANELDPDPGAHQDAHQDAHLETHLEAHLDTHLGHGNRQSHLPSRAQTASHQLPRIHVAWDGLVVSFERESHPRTDPCKPARVAVH